VPLLLLSLLLRLLLMPLVRMLLLLSRVCCKGGKAILTDTGHRSEGRGSCAVPVLEHAHHAPQGCRLCLCTLQPTLNFSLLDVELAHCCLHLSKPVVPRVCVRLLQLHDTSICCSKRVP
jgi:hypothetical protein